MTAPPLDPVQLGVAGDLVAASHGAPAAADSRVGGAPLLPGGGAPAGWARPACGVCGTNMALVLQVREGLLWWNCGVHFAAEAPADQPSPPPQRTPTQAHAPLPRHPDRVLVVFGCAGDECGRADAAWAAVRVQGAAVAVAEAETPAAAHSPPLPPPPPPPADDDWGLGADDGASASSMSLADVSAELERAAAALAAAPPQTAARPRDAGTPEPAQRPPPPPCWTPAEWGPPRLVEFYVGWKAEPSPRAPLPPSSAPDDAHVAALLAAYRAAGGDDAEAVPDDDACGGGGSGAPSAPATTATASWSGEAYEPDAAPGASSAYLAFAARVAREPGQLARYSLGTPPLWPLAPGRGATSRPPAPPPPPPCSACASPRRWEVALVSPLAALLDEAVDWAGGGKSAPGCPAGWEWTTVAVATCERDCGGASEPGGVVAVREHVCVANEE